MINIIKNKLSKYPILYSTAGLIYMWINVIISFPMLLFKVKDTKITVCNYYGKGYGDNAKYIIDEILKQNLDYDIVWLLKENLIDKEKLPKGIRIVKYPSLRGLYELSTSKIWIDNCRKNFYPIKKSQQFYINTGHGGVPLKKVEKDAEKNLHYLYIYKAKKDSKMTDLMISNSTFKTRILKESYWYNGDILEIGIPKIEPLILSDKKTISKVKLYYGLDNNVRILLYAPTFRKENSIKYYDIDFNKIKQELEYRFGGTWKILFRLHPNLSENIINKKYKDENLFINATDYPDMQELLMASDILITDYSGTMFEYIYMNKPVFLYAKDIQNYDRGFYFDFSKLPFPLATDNIELENIIRTFDYDDYYREVESFKLNIGLIEDFGASKKIVDIIKEFIEKNN